MGRREIETDYLVVGAGAAGMAFADALVAASDARASSSTAGTRPAAIGTTRIRSSASTSPRSCTA